MTSLSLCGRVGLCFEPVMHTPSSIVPRWSLLLPYSAILGTNLLMDIEVHQDLMAAEVSDLNDYDCRRGRQWRSNAGSGAGGARTTYPRVSEMTYHKAYD